MSDATRRVELIFFHAGGGHRAAALALKEVLEQHERPWEVTLLDLGELLRPLDVVRKISGIQLQEAYNGLLKSGWTLGASVLLKGIQRLIRFYHDDEVRLLEQHWLHTRPALVVSLVPNFNRACAESVRRVGAAPFITVLTDFADYPPHFWMEREPQYFVCGTQHAVDQALALGHAADRIFLTSGMILGPNFYKPISVSRAAARERFGLRAETPTGLVLFGGEGSKAIPKIARYLEASGLDLQLILVCGRNATLERKLRRVDWRLPVHIEGFTREIPALMHVCDFFIGKPGPGSLSEAFAMGLPAIVELNAWTLPQERFNAEWVRERQLGLVVTSFRHVAGAVDQLLRASAVYRTNVARIRNRAVFEIPDLLETIIATSS